MNLETSRRWIVENASVKNALGQPTGYALLPGENAEQNRDRRRDSRRWQVLVVLQAIAAGEVALGLEGTGLNT